MGNLFNINSVLYRILAKIGNLVILNLLFLICSLPVVTIGASSTALYTVTLKMAKDRENYIVKDFLYAFKKNFRQSTIIWVLLLFLAIILLVDANLCNALAGPGIIVLAVLIRIFMLIWIMIFTYVFPVLAKFNNTVKATMKNAFVMSGVHLFTTVVTVGMNCLPFAFLYFSEKILIYIVGIYTGIGFAGIAYLNSTLLNRVFQRYMDDMDEEESLWEP